ncbi:Rad4-domain-containing protein, partial [Sporormia fimetaria CBS 119925]
MPPTLHRKRVADTPPPAPEQARKRRHKESTRTRPRKDAGEVWKTLDAAPRLLRSQSKIKALLEQEDESSVGEEEDEDEEMEFEHVASRPAENGELDRDEEEGSDDGDEDDSDDAAEEDDERYLSLLPTTPSASEPTPSAVSLTIEPHHVRNNTFAREKGKKGASKRQKEIRIQTHCLHVQFLMAHNMFRNAWVQDKEVQRVLVRAMGDGCWKEVERWWRDSGLGDGEKRVVEGGREKKEKLWGKTAQRGVEEFKDDNKKAKAGSAMNKKTRKRGQKEAEAVSSKDEAGHSDIHRNQRDWGAASDRAEPNTPNLSAGDPLIRLLRYLTAYWKAKFRITAPCLRKRGYLSPSILKAEIGAWKEDPSDMDIFGERIRNLEEFREVARKCEGSRDVGQQLFTALLRGLGIEARMVASLQPAGIGWSQVEEGNPKDLEKLKARRTRSVVVPPPVSKTASPVKPTRGAQGRITTNFDDEESSDLSSVISISSSSASRPIISRKNDKARKYAEQLPYPTYWTEAISPLTNNPICVSPFPTTIIAPTSSTTPNLSSFYPRGSAADKAKQVFAYTLAFSPDNTAKDVTTRYLPSHTWPGRTKGFRLPPSKIPIYNRRGKIQRYITHDWFSTILRPYLRAPKDAKPWDEWENTHDLVPASAAKVPTLDDSEPETPVKESLQAYKASTKYILPIHLLRDQALHPSAHPIRHFHTTKGVSHPVYPRSALVSCKSVEQWRREGREIKAGEQPLKHVAPRAVTAARKLEILDREREDGTPVLQGLYAEFQTQWIVPEAVGEDGKIPVNGYGNVDVFVKSMVPRGAVHVAIKGVKGVCRKLGVEFAEACVGFEFGKRRAVPVMLGVVVKEGDEGVVRDAWREECKVRREKEEKKRTEIVLGTWRRWCKGLVVRERMGREFGDDEVEEVREMPGVEERSGRMEGGFLRDGEGEEEMEGGFVREGEQEPGGFLRDDEDQEQLAGGFLLEEDDDEKRTPSKLTIEYGDYDIPRKTATPLSSRQTPISLSAAAQ